MIKTKSNSEHYFWGEQCHGWRMYDTESLNVTREMIPPGKCEKMHFHTIAMQCFYIIEGLATFEVEKEFFDVNADESFIIEPGKHHKISNKTNEELHFLVISQPATRNDRINVED
jgi:mannose-6-phosphate isomerase-like protein (cupin superfamily)